MSLKLPTNNNPGSSFRIITETRQHPSMAYAGSPGSRTPQYRPRRTWSSSRAEETRTLSRSCHSKPVRSCRAPFIFITVTHLEADERPRPAVDGGGGEHGAGGAALTVLQRRRGDVEPGARRPRGRVVSGPARRGAGQRRRALHLGGGSGRRPFPPARQPLQRVGALAGRALGPRLGAGRLRVGHVARARLRRLMPRAALRRVGHRELVEVAAVRPRAHQLRRHRRRRRAPAGVVVVVGEGVPVLARAPAPPHGLPDVHLHDLGVVLARPVHLLLSFVVDIRTQERIRQWINRSFVSLLT